MIVTLYKSPGERNILYRDKEIVAIYNDVQTTDIVSVETPTILVDRDDSIIGFDYAYIDTFNRFYFVNSFEIVNGNQFKLYLESDPLESFRAQIDNSETIAKRSTNRGNLEIEDPLVVFKNKPNYRTVKCATGFAPDGSGYCYALILGGK